LKGGIAPKRIRPQSIVSDSTNKQIENNNNNNTSQQSNNQNEKFGTTPKRRGKYQDLLGTDVKVRK